MLLTVYYVVVPTPALIEEAKRAGEEWLLEPDVWIDQEHDRVPPNYSRDAIEKALWTVFLAKLACPETETDIHRRFRLRCLELGFSGCWAIHVAHAGDPIDDLFAEAAEHAKLASIASRV
jgi:hypothetical protein